MSLNLNIDVIFLNLGYRKIACCIITVAKSVLACTNANKRPEYITRVTS